MTAPRVELERAKQLHRSGRSEEAETAYRKLLADDPSNAGANAALGELLLQSKRYGEAVALFERAVAQAPFEAEYQNNLGYAHSLNSTWEFGLVSLLRANELKPRTYSILVNIASCLQKMGAPDRALPYLEELIALRPGDASAEFMLGNALSQLGRFDDAERHLERAVAGGAKASALRSLAAMKKQTPQHNIADRIEAALGQPALPPEDLVALHQAATKVYSDLGRHDDVFRHAVAAKRHSEGDFSREDFAARLACVGDLFTEEFFAARTGFGASDLLPIFIVGMPRSGSTLAEQSLSAHSMISGAGERPYLSVIDARLGLGNCDLYRRSLSTLPAAISAEIGRGYWSLISAVATDKPHIVDKSLYNFQHLGLGRLLFPNARIIWCRRDALDCCLSIFLSPLNEAHAYAKSLADLGWYYREHEKLMRRWQAQLPGRIFELRYEDMIADQRGTTRRLLDFIGVPWEEACMNFQDNIRPVATISKWQVRQPLYRSSVGRWHAYERHLGPLLDALDTPAA